MLDRLPVPDGFADGFPEAERRRLWHGEVSETVTQIAKDGPVPSGDEQFDRAWKKLSADRPNVPPETCRLRRQLIKKRFWMLSDYTRPDTE